MQATLAACDCPVACSKFWLNCCNCSHSLLLFLSSSLFFPLCSKQQLFLGYITTKRKLIPKSKFHELLNSLKMFSIGGWKEGWARRQGWNLSDPAAIQGYQFIRIYWISAIGDVPVGGSYNAFAMVTSTTATCLQMLRFTDWWLCIVLLGIHWLGSLGSTLTKFL